MTRTGVWAVLLVVTVSTPPRAQNSLNESAGLRHCNELNGTNFYFEQRDRVLNLLDYRRSLDNLTAQGAYNPETKRPWSK